MTRSLQIALFTFLAVQPWPMRHVAWSHPQTNTAGVNPSSVPDALGTFSGTFEFVGGEAERDGVDAAIDAVVSEMNVFIRSIARSRLSAANPVPSNVKIGPHPRGVEIMFDERKYVSELDGDYTRVVGVTGERVRYKVETAKRRLTQVFVGDSGTRKNTFALTGDRLVISVRVRSEQLPRPLEYRLTFRRAQP